MPPRIHVVLLFALAVLMASTAKAQFQPPSQDELKMTTDPQAPGAAASYLYLEEKGDDKLHFHSLYVRIKILSEKGKTLGTIHVPYERGMTKISNIQGRTIHADGTIFPMVVKPEDLLAAKSKDVEIKEKVFNLPSVEVGSIIEYRWQMDYDDHWLISPHWILQRDYFIHKAHYEFQPNEMSLTYLYHLLYYGNLPPGYKVTQDASRKYVLNVKDLPPYEEEEYSPPPAAGQYQLRFYYSTYMSGTEFWDHEGKKWFSKVTSISEPTDALRSAASQLVASSDTDEVKARKLYKAVQQLENTDYSDRERKINKLIWDDEESTADEDKAELVWTRKYGDSNELALLYLALLRAVHIDAHAFQVVNRHHRNFNAGYLSMRQFEDVLVLATLGDKQVILDPGEKFCTFGQLPWQHQLTGGMLEQNGKVSYGETPSLSYKQATTARTADIKIDGQGKMTGTVRVVMNGQQAMHWRQRAQRVEDKALKKEFQEHLRSLVPDTVEIEFDHFLGLDSQDTNLMAIANVSGQMGTVTGKHLFLPAFFFEAQVKPPFVATEKRQNIVDMRYAELLQDQVTYHLPDGYSMEGKIDDVTQTWGTHATLQTRIVLKGNDLICLHVLARGIVRVEAKDYPELRGFYSKIAAIDQQQIALTRTE